MTSGNISHEPLCITEEEAYARLKDVADGTYIDRPIINRRDDSVCFAAGDMRMIRRSRGFATTQF